MIPSFIKDSLKKFEDLIFGTSTVLSLNFPEKARKHFENIQKKTGTPNSVELVRLSLTQYEYLFDQIKEGSIITICNCEVTIKNKDGEVLETFDVGNIYPSLKKGE